MTDRVERSIILTQDGPYLYFTLEDGRCEVRYDLKKRAMQRLKNGNWGDIERAYRYFCHYTIDHLKTTNEKFKNMILLVKKLNYGCKSVSTFIARLDESFVTEGYTEQGILFEGDSYNTNYGRNKYIISKPLSFYDAHFILLFKKSGFKVTRQFERSYEQNKKIFNDIAYVISHLNLDNATIKELLVDLEHEYSWHYIRNLTTVHKYDMKSLLGYIFNYLIPFENYRLQEALNDLNDYYTMGDAIGRDIKKYPKYLKSIHDIILANYNAHKEQYDEALFAKNQKPQLAFDDKEFSVVIPSCTKDVISEGTTLNHCVSSYVKKIIAGETYIIFMRRSKFKDMPLVTLEYKENSLIQAKGHSNRALLKEEMDFLKRYCEKKEIILRVGE